MRRRWLLWLLGGGACFLSACATTGRYVKKCAPATPQFATLVEDALDSEDYTPQLESLAAQTALCVVNQVVADFLARHDAPAQAMLSLGSPTLAAGVDVQMAHARNWLVMHGEPR